jgi:hypothetical protein
VTGIARYDSGVTGQSFQNGKATRSIWWPGKSAKPTCLLLRGCRLHRGLNLLPSVSALTLLVVVCELLPAGPIRSGRIGAALGMQKPPDLILPAWWFPAPFVELERRES